MTISVRFWALQLQLNGGHFSVEKTVVNTSMGGGCQAGNQMVFHSRSVTVLPHPRAPAVGSKQSLCFNTLCSLLGVTSWGLLGVPLHLFLSSPLFWKSTLWTQVTIMALLLALPPACFHVSQRGTCAGSLTQS